MYVLLYVDVYTMYVHMYFLSMHCIYNEYTCMYMYIHCIYLSVQCMNMFMYGTYVYVLLKQPFVMHLGLFGDHIVSAVLYRYTQVLLREDLVNTKGKPLLTVARLKAVWK
jgi:hypothetical protein